jgi:prepilin-type processing-associated H-X9-DG protein
VVAKELRLPLVYESQSADPNFDSLQTHSFGGVKNNGIFQCPTEKPAFKNFWGGVNSTSYTHNSGWNYGYGLGISDGYTNHPTPVYRLYWGRVRRTDVAKPHKTFLLGESITGNGWYDYAISQFAYVTSTSTYHKGGANFLWTDGHATHIYPDQLTLANFSRLP